MYVVSVVSPLRNITDNISAKLIIKSLSQLYRVKGGKTVIKIIDEFTKASGVDAAASF